MDRPRKQRLNERPSSAWEETLRVVWSTPGDGGRVGGGAPPADERRPARPDRPRKER
jgi:hypothetical protein